VKRDFIYELNGKNVRNTSLNLEIYEIGIDASIKADNPDLLLIEEALKLANNDPLIMLRSLAVMIRGLVVNGLNDIRVNEVLEDIYD
jgi:hypothetical protein